MPKPRRTLAAKGRFNGLAVTAAALSPGTASSLPRPKTAGREKGRLSRGGRRPTGYTESVAEGSRRMGCETRVTGESPKIDRKAKSDE